MPGVHKSYETVPSPGPGAALGICVCPSWNGHIRGSCAKTIVPLVDNADSSGGRREIC